MTDRYTLVNDEKMDTSGNEVGTRRFINDPRIINLNKGQQLVCRMLRFTDKLSSRNTPWIVKTIHSFLEEVDTDTYMSRFTTCPASPYLNIRNWEKQCKICQTITQVEQKAKNSVNTIEKEKLNRLARTIKRKWKTFIPVYVIADSENLDNNNTSKIIMFHTYTVGQNMNAWASRSNDISKYFNNFKSGGYNLIINVDKNSVFEMKNTFEYTKEPIIDVNLPAEAFIEQHIKPLKFDEDFYDSFDPDKHTEFFNTFVPTLVQGLGILDDVNITESTYTPQTKTEDSDDLGFVIKKETQSSEQEEAHSTENVTKQEAPVTPETVKPIPEKKPTPPDKPEAPEPTETTEDTSLSDFLDDIDIGTDTQDVSEPEPETVSEENENDKTLAEIEAFINELPE